MQNNKPQKILGKKYVRGKPYYKVKWEGAGKQLSSWQSPIRLKQYKSMINKYEIKNWGTPLDQKFFDPILYEGKNTHPKRKAPEKKKATPTKKVGKKKIEQVESQSQQSEPQQSSSEQSRSEQQRKADQDDLQEPQPSKKSAYKKIQEQEAPIIDLQLVQQRAQSHHVNQNIGNKAGAAEVGITQFETDKIDKVAEGKNWEENTCKTIRKSNQIDINQFDEKRRTNDCEPLTQQVQYYRDLGLKLPQAVTPSPNKISAEKQGLKIKKPLSILNAINIEIEGGRQKIQRIAHIYHLEKVNSGNHLYLVEFNDKQMRKMTTKDLLDRYPNELVNFLEARYKAKHIAGLV